MNKVGVKKILNRIWPLEIVLMAVPSFLLIIFKIDIFYGYFIFDLNLPFSKETVVTIFMAYELILSGIVAMSISYVLAIIINQFR
jgi:hypothetical protein